MNATRPALTSPADPSFADQAHDAIRRRILDNVWAPGHRALEQEVALALGMSRTPVREALVRLQAEGLIEVVPRRGMHVLPVSPRQMREIYEVLTALETLAIELLARRQPTASELAPLVDATGDMDRALQADDLDGWAGADARFHADLIALAGNEILVAAAARLSDRVHRARMFSLRLRPKPVHSTAEHRALVEALLAGASDEAIRANRAHRERASGELLAIFERFRLSHL